MSRFLWFVACYTVHYSKGEDSRATWIVVERHRQWADITFMYQNTNLSGVKARLEFFTVLRYLHAVSPVVFFS